MLKLRYIAVKNWCQHVEKRVDFATGTTVLLGANGSGKSNLLHAGFNCLTGELCTNDTIGDNINWLADTSIIETGFTIDGVDGIVTREYTAPLIKDEAGKITGRDKHKSKASLKFGTGKKINSAKKVTERLSEILGLSSSIVRDHVIVPQGKLQDLLFRPKQERIKTFQSLVPALLIADKKRVDVRAELERNPPVSTGRSRDEIQVSIDQVKERESFLTVEVGKLNKRLVAFGDLNGHRSLIQKAEQAKNADAEVARIVPLRTATEVEVGQLRKRQADWKTHIASLQTMVDTGAPRASELQNVLAVLEQNEQAFAARQAAETQLSAAIEEHGSRQAPVAYAAPDWLAKAEQDRVGIAASVTAAEKVLVFLSSGKLECPTCGTKFEDLDAQKAYQEQALATLRPSLQQHDEAIGQVTALERQAQQAQQQYALWLQGVNARETQLRTSLETLPVGEAADTQKKAQWRQELTELNKLSGDLQTAKDKAAEEAPNLATAEGNLAQHDKDLVRLRVVAEGKVTDTTLESMRTALAQAEELQATYHAKSGELTAHGSELVRLQAQYDAITSDKGLALAVDKYRGMLEHAYTVLHRDQLPQEVMLSYLGDLNRLCAKYLDIFGNPFAIQVPRDFDITVTRPDGYTCQASRESGGRKAALSIVFRFAINQLFASQVGLIALDEPTAYLDQDNLGYVADIVDQMHRVKSETGLQIIMITHERSLISAFDHVEEIG